MTSEMYEMYSNKKKAKEPSEKLRIVLDDGPETGIVVEEEEYLRKLFKISPEKGFDLLFRKFYGSLCSHCIRFVHSKAVAEDIVSEIFVNFWQKKGYENIETSFKAYLYKSVQYRSYSYLKKEFLRTTNEKAEVNNAYRNAVEMPDDILLYHEISLKLDQLIKELPAQCRRAFQLSRLEGKKYREIAREMNITVSAVERLISRALTKIRAELRPGSPE